MKKNFWAALVGAALMATASHAQGQGTLLQDQTQGYGADKILTFTYRQNFDCVDQPLDNLDFKNGRAARDTNEIQIPICQVGTNPTINPPGQTGAANATTDPIYVLIPMFSTDGDTNPDDAISCKDVVPGTVCGKALGTTLIKLFGAIPEGFKATPKVYTQCPAPGERPGTCTMHASRVDLAPVLASLGYIANPPTANVFVPTPNHSHVLDDSDISLKQEWWQVIPVLVMQQSDWPPQDGSTGITSVAKLQSAEQAGRAIEAPSNFFLFFGSKPMAMDMSRH